MRLSDRCCSLRLAEPFSHLTSLLFAGPGTFLTDRQTDRHTYHIPTYPQLTTTNQFSKGTVRGGDEDLRHTGDRGLLTLNSQRSTTCSHIIIIFYPSPTTIINTYFFLLLLLPPPPTTSSIHPPLPLPFPHNI
ncbi:hypothetical protein P167DRAFT_159520 [Morchella conica CCBAS932]|uniref:Uncharacterized protein n=1 Tax=Morchella conica CCBAS932 TaxID=1392247 RepID=A0A3N4KPZ9_9PEZI|nr:hypothetical protein P167DRAFT_159520 [Morchella conica CCBAS932]